MHPSLPDGHRANFRCTKHPQGRLGCNLAETHTLMAPPRPAASITVLDGNFLKWGGVLHGPGHPSRHPFQPPKADKAMQRTLGTRITNAAAANFRELGERSSPKKSTPQNKATTPGKAEMIG